MSGSGVRVVYPPQPPPLDVSEAAFQRLVVDLAEVCGWKVFHNADSRRTQAGVLDLLLIRGPVLWWWEMKTTTGRVRPAQRDFLALLWGAGQRATVVRPGDWLWVVATLTAEEGA